MQLAQHAFDRFALQLPKELLNQFLYARGPALSQQAMTRQQRLTVSTLGVKKA
ncbi:MAG: hypothetical protein AAF961_04475 [Planctomycetota bacterium]